MPGREVGRGAAAAGALGTLVATVLCGAVAAWAAETRPGESSGAAAGATRPAARPSPSEQGGREGDALRGLFVGGGQRGPINIDARRFEADNRKRVVTYSDHVVVRQDATTLNADKVTVTYDESRRLSQVTAEGSVRIVQKASAAQGEAATEREVQCVRIVFQVAEERITCTGQPAMVRQGEDVIRGPRIVVLVGEERITVEGDAGSRVSSVITPRGDALDAGRQAPRREGGNPGQAGAQAGGPARPQ
jgi:lipopolysaccharide transport protein LptA